MRSFDPDTLATLTSGRAVTRELVLFDFASGLWGFWTGSGVLTYEGVDYVGSGQLLQIDGLSSQSGLTADVVTITLSAINVPPPPASLWDELNAELPWDDDAKWFDTAPQTWADVLATIENEQYHQRPCTVSRAYFDPDTRALLSVERLKRGYVDQMVHLIQQGGEATLTCTVETRFRDLTRFGNRVRGDADQRRIDPADGFFKFAATAGEIKIVWGRNP